MKAELLTFPAGRRDDQVNALGLAGQPLNKLDRGTAPKRERAERRDGYAR